MKFDTTKKSAILGIYSLGSGVICQFAFMVFATAAESPGIFISSTLFSYIGYIFLFIGLISLYNNSRKDHSLSDIKDSSSKNILYLIAISLILFFLFVIIGIYTEKQPGIGLH